MGKVEYALKTLLYPVPVLLVSSGTEDGRSSIMTARWTGAVGRYGFTAGKDIRTH